MNPVDFPGSNKLYKKPNNMTDEQCFTVHACESVDIEGFKYVLTAWMPSYEDLKAMNNGRPIYLKIIGGGMPPVALFTLDENNEANF
jgi:hypothetical protein